ncbi:hypothetical protein [Microvirga pudoricolor]|uniref:hypothetical protein n=1 Tax=Microvirga pudoricolor TaxID=2778729 RepID=UPI001950A99D|nr:hypothetical protein [Microvirga pudoricolor]MBM6595433.1 hypothetical protein [Microvirga pudoricolor]
MRIARLANNASDMNRSSEDPTSRARAQAAGRFQILSFAEQAAHIYLGQPFRALKRQHLPSELFMHPAVIADDELILSTEEDLRELLGTALRDDRKRLLAAFDRADIVEVIRISGWSYARAWAELKEHRSQGRIRAIRPGRPAAVGDIICLNETFVDVRGPRRRWTGQWFCRVERIEDCFVRLEIVETRKVPPAIKAARHADPRLLTSWLEGTHPDFSAERLRRPGEGRAMKK